MQAGSSICCPTFCAPASLLSPAAMRTPAISTGCNRTVWQASRHPTARRACRASGARNMRTLGLNLRALPLGSAGRKGDPTAGRLLKGQRQREEAGAPPDICFGAGCPPEDLISRRLSSPCDGGPSVRIHHPPAGSRLRTFSGANQCQPGQNQLSRRLLRCCGYPE